MKRESAKFKISNYQFIQTIFFKVNDSLDLRIDGTRASVKSVSVGVTFGFFQAFMTFGADDIGHALLYH